MNGISLYLEGFSRSELNIDYKTLNEFGIKLLEKKAPDKLKSLERVLVRVPDNHYLHTPREIIRTNSLPDGKNYSPHITMNNHEINTNSLLHEIYKSLIIKCLVPECITHSQEGEKLCKRCQTAIQREETEIKADPKETIEKRTSNQTSSIIDLLQNPLIKEPGIATEIIHSF